MPADLTPPPMIDADPAPGRRVRQTDPAYAGTEVYHALYLPTDWAPGGRYPVIVEYAGNHWQTCLGTPEGCSLGHGISGGAGFVWVCLPYVEVGRRRNALTWWGDREATLDYCRRTVDRVCADYCGDPAVVLLAGFSRGSLACNYLGLHDDTIASLWRGFICHSHYDGVFPWPYPESDRASAQTRLARLRGRPQFLSHERDEAHSLDAARRYLAEACPEGDFTFLDLPFSTHTDTWVLSDNPERRLLREWVERVLSDAR